MFNVHPPHTHMQNAHTHTCIPHIHMVKNGKRNKAKWWYSSTSQFEKTKQTVGTVELMCLSCHCVSLRFTIKGSKAKSAKGRNARGTPRQSEHAFLICLPGGITGGMLNFPAPHRENTWHDTWLVKECIRDVVPRGFIGS